MSQDYLPVVARKNHHPLSSLDCYRCRRIRLLSNIFLVVVAQLNTMTVSVGILSIGDMGMGIARLLKANAYRVLTVGAGRR